MKDLIEKVLRYLPEYLANFGTLLFAPKEFISRQIFESDDGYTESHIFLSVSLALAIIMTLPLQPMGVDFWRYVAAMAVAVLLGVSIGAGIVWMAWRLVGGDASPQGIFIAYSHLSGVTLVILSAFQLVGVGVIKVFEPELYQRLLDQTADFRSSQEELWGYPMLISNGIYLLGIASVLVWLVIAWGVFRRLNNSSRARSFIAGAIAVTLSVPGAAIVYIVLSAMSL